ncbi:MAG: hypothetical protein ACE366_15060 [Bradymonadia bacterium]
MRTPWICTLGLALCACIDPPEEGAIEISIVTDAAQAYADGLGRATVEVQLDEAARLFRREVEIQVTGATIGDDTEHQTTTPEDGLVQVPIRFGRIPGPVLVEVKAGPYTALDDSLMLSARLPDEVVVTAPERPLTADGFDSANVTLDLVVDGSPARVSEGLRVWLTPCCDGPRDCDTPLLSVPRLLEVDPNQDQVQLTITAPTLPTVGADAPVISTPIAVGLEGAPRCGDAEHVIELSVRPPVDPFLEDP